MNLLETQERVINSLMLPTSFAINFDLNTLNSHPVNAFHSAFFNVHFQTSKIKNKIYRNNLMKLVLNPTHETCQKTNNEKMKTRKI